MHTTILPVHTCSWGSYKKRWRLIVWRLCSILASWMHTVTWAISTRYQLIRHRPSQLPPIHSIFTLILIIYPHCSLHISVHLQATGDSDSAKRCYLEAIRIRPDFAIAWSNLAGVFKDEGQLKTSIAYYQEAIRLCPEFADAHSNLGNVLKESGELEEAISCYQVSEMKS
jgi:tetratricopeptide (TPR) repeat protein